LNERFLSHIESIFTILFLGLLRLHRLLLTNDPEDEQESFNDEYFLFLLLFFSGESKVTVSVNPQTMSTMIGAKKTQRILSRTTPFRNTERNCVGKNAWAQIHSS
jgi:hypothetical protein